uniref:Putative secreted protein n=1 Tax=Lutzomyia longipalpis TaxID=7200 RepID=A0A7G3AQF2_LUTLO
MALGRILLLLIPFWVFLSMSSVNCKEVCFSPSLDAKENDSNCVVRGFSLNSTELLRVKTLFLGGFCGYRDQVYDRFFVSSESSSDLSSYEKSFYFDLGCSQMFDSISGLLYWAPMAYARKYFELFSYSHVELIVKKNQYDRAEY